MRGKKLSLYLGLILAIIICNVMMGSLIYAEMMESSISNNMEYIHNILDQATRNLDEKSLREIHSDNVYETIINNKITESGYLFLADKDGTILIHPNKELVGTNISQREFIKDRLDYDAGTIEYEYLNENKILFYRTSKSGFKLIFITSKDELVSFKKAYIMVAIMIVTLIEMIICLILVKLFFKDEYYYDNQIGSCGNDELKSKLERLKNYRLNNTITEEEYNRKRESIIDKYEI
ncbi:MAG: cache domain-containing protein [Anaeromicrobium sp.]|uniref:cache domain-containing protein n=1 Tax=Anaeromicrobium sp. TaxID=1929132 RepID=UPI0025F57D97|nr:cache domain-containing protein [Anaeromicrobium sp.]MCT4595246.1 cache domain-containing protein [Anaeromicrobium sp.]